MWGVLDFVSHTVFSQDPVAPLIGDVSVVQNHQQLMDETQASAAAHNRQLLEAQASTEAYNRKILDQMQVLPRVCWLFVGCIVGAIRRAQIQCFHSFISETTRDLGVLCSLFWCFVLIGLWGSLGFQ
jgi:hypothetical protein